MPPDFLKEIVYTNLYALRRVGEDTVKQHFIGEGAIIVSDVPGSTPMTGDETYRKSL